MVTIHFSGLLTKPDWPGCHNHGTIFICWHLKKILLGSLLPLNTTELHFVELLFRLY